MFLRYLQYLLTVFRQTFVTGASRDRDELIRFWGQKVKVQGHTIAAEAHSTRRYRRVQLFLVTPVMKELYENFNVHNIIDVIKEIYLLFTVSCYFLFTLAVYISTT